MGVASLPLCNQEPSWQLCPMGLSCLMVPCITQLACGSFALVLSLDNAISSTQRQLFLENSDEFMLYEEIANITSKFLNHQLVYYESCINTQEEFESKIINIGGHFLCSPVLEDQTLNHLIFIDTICMLVFDASHQNAKIGQGIDMKNDGWQKEVQEWDTWRLVDVRMVVANHSHNLVSCACGAQFRMDEEQAQMHIKGKKHKRAMAKPALSMHE